LSSPDDITTNCNLRGIPQACAEMANRNVQTAAFAAV